MSPKETPPEPDGTVDLGRGLEGMSGYGALRWRMMMNQRQEIKGTIPSLKKESAENHHR